MPQPRSRHAAELLSDGRVLIVGGEGEWPERDLRSALIYDPATREFDAVPPMMVERMDATATRLRNGRVLIAGGYKIESPYASPVAELYVQTPNRRRAVKH